MYCANNNDRSISLPLDPLGIVSVSTVVKGYVGF